MSGRKNLSYITEDFDVTDEADMLREVAGSKRVVLLADGAEDAMRVLRGGSYASPLAQLASDAGVHRGLGHGGSDDRGGPDPGGARGHGPGGRRQHRPGTR